MELPYLVFSDNQGKIYHHPFLRMAVFSPSLPELPTNQELIKVPQGSSFLYLPGRIPLGFNPKTNTFNFVREFNKKEVFALAAFPIPAYLRLRHPAAVITEKKLLPLWAYTACGFFRNDFYITAVRVDSRVRQSPRFYDSQQISYKVKCFLKQYPDNRLYRHLANCALNYNCLAAKNLFLERWEAPLPVAQACNANCLGCISDKYSECVASHKRIAFKPKLEEVEEVMDRHLKVAREAIVSFGQGCEGEPLMEAELIAQSVARVRRKNSRGTINVNTNASIPERVKLLCSAGVDSFRVSLNSPSEKFYNLYFNPKNYKFKDVLKSIAVAKKYNKFVSINLFMFPGFSDSSQQVDSLKKFIKNNGIDMIQWRNLNIDPVYYLEKMDLKDLRPLGMLFLLKEIKQNFPLLKTGYFNLPRESFNQKSK